MQGTLPSSLSLPHSEPLLLTVPSKSEKRKLLLEAGTARDADRLPHDTGLSVPLQKSLRMCVCAGAHVYLCVLSMFSYHQFTSIKISQMRQTCFINVPKFVKTWSLWPRSFLKSS